MAYTNALAAFSPNSDYFAHSSPDGCLKIWETSSNSLKQEYTPSAHLSSTCSALSWDPCKHVVDKPKKKPKRARSANVAASIANLKLIAMGTLSGDVLLYSVARGDLHMKLANGHTDVVNSISWLTEEDTLFSCSNDQHIIRWSISEGTVTSKWKAGKLSVHFICVVDSNSLLSASSSITWWDIKTQNALKTFTGHAAEVTCILPVSLTENSVNSQYFVTSAVGDRVVSVWLLSESSDGSSVASFTLSDEPCGLDISGNSSKSQPLILSAVTKSGLLHVFEHQLNGKMKKPVKPKTTVHIASAAKDSEKSLPLPVLASKIDKSLDSCYIAYGSFVKPVFEKLELQLLDSESYLIRQNQTALPSAFEGVTKIKEPDRSKNAKLLAPGYMAPAKPTENVSRKKKRKASSGNELPMAERLNAMRLSKEPEEQESDPNPSSESMSHLLLQGLQSNDNKLLHTVLRCSDQALITNTVKRLPLSSVPIFLKELHKRLSRKDQGNRPCLRWLRGVLGVHLSYLMSLREIDEYIGPVSQLIDAREDTFSKMLQLKGFLDILWSQIDSRTQRDPNIPTEPLLAYEDASSSDDEASVEDEEEMETEHSEGEFEVDALESESEVDEKSNGVLSAADDEAEDS